jgi:hypothetical protein
MFINRGKTRMLMIGRPGQKSRADHEHFEPELDVLEQAPGATFTKLKIGF